MSIFCLLNSGYMFSSDVLGTIEKYSMDLADSVMKRAKDVYQNFHNVSVSWFTPPWAVNEPES